MRRSLFDHFFVGSNVAITNENDAMRVLGNVHFVRDYDDGITLAMQIFEKGHDFFAGLRIQVACRLIGQDD